MTIALPLRQTCSVFLSCSLLALTACTSTPPQATWSYQTASSRQAIPPDQAYPELFQAVQQQWVFDDQKHFVDALPLRDPARIRADYLAQRDRSGFDLKRFVDENFQPSAPAETRKPTTGTDLREHINNLWPALTRHYEQVPAYSSMLPLPYPYVVPGGRFRELYYWDSYFTMLGLMESGEEERTRHMLDDFAYLIDTYGHIPNGNRTYYLSRSQPPFFSFMVELEAQAKGDNEIYRRYLPQMQKEYAYWMEGAQTLKPGEAAKHVVRLADGSLFNRYWDASDTPRQESYMQDRETASKVPDRPASEVYRDLRAGAESGWDYTSRWLGDRKNLATIRTTAIVPIDLNSLMYHLEATIALACQKSAMPRCTQSYQARANQRQQAIERHLWNSAGYYADYDWQKNQLSDQITAATLYPLFAGVASPERARQTAATVETHLVKSGGLATTQVQNGQQWDKPNGWAPLQWIAVDGLRRYGHDSLARTIGENFLHQVQALFQKEHKLVEKYDVEGTSQGGGGGEYALQDGFGWTNGVTLKLLDLYPQKESTSQP
ncbi:alpha,alpha-trehalase [Pseudomonas duriflava]|uniref:Periplasmic trehalase n=1 Tax=Pseudomonas duriflava TaxID=459528 RepID=A0A562QFS6_9PSED|nr:alpha,alpha-trehalase TreA [Pseudomonas duriflava]TWI55591.1 alpha,alpha-trehalase [Pseudomonas duriflava]